MILKHVCTPEPLCDRSNCYHHQHLSDAKNPNGIGGIGVTCPVGIVTGEV
jgi:hypothetical protein